MDREAMNPRLVASYELPEGAGVPAFCAVDEVSVAERLLRVHLVDAGAAVTFCTPVRVTPGSGRTVRQWPKLAERRRISEGPYRFHATFDRK
jgi:hypothetical protein